MKKFTGNIRLSRISTNNEPYHFFELSLFDENGTFVLSSEISTTNIGDFLTMREVECLFKIGPNLNNIGKKRVCKTEKVSYSYGADKQSVLSPYEVDGWKCVNKDDLDNPHKGTNGVYNVVFYRYED